MTDAMMSLKGLIEKAPDADILREMISFAGCYCAHDGRPGIDP